MPLPTIERFKQIASDYERMWDFPNCIGSIDGKHVRIKCPAHSGSMFFNYKKFFSVHLQGITDARYKFITIDVGDYGRRSDSGVFMETGVYHHLENNSFNVPPPKPLPGTNEHVPHVFLGDQGYPLKEYLMRPYPTMNNIDPEKENFNYRLSRARRSVECAFGILVSKWRCLKTELQVEPCHVDTIVKTVCLLHNIVIDKDGIKESVLFNIQSQTAEHSFETEHDITNLRRFNRSSRRAYEIRDIFKQYFKDNTINNLNNRVNL